MCAWHINYDAFISSLSNTAVTQNQTKYNTTGNVHIMKQWDALP